MTVPLGVAGVATLPLMLLAWLVFRSGLGLGAAAWVTSTFAAALAATVFSLGARELWLGVAKGAWTGLWILLIMIPALLLFQITESSGALNRLSDALQSLAPTRGRLLVLLAWVFPSLLQGVAGFGVPVVVAAPMLSRAGLTPGEAIAACMLGYHWSVTFGSMGSSFFIAAGTTQLDAAESAEFAIRSAMLLAVSSAVGMLVVLRHHGARKEAILPALAIAGVMGAVLIAVAAVQPALGSTAAGAAGLAAAMAILPRTRARGAARQHRRPGWAVLGTTAFPYIVLIVTVVMAFGVPAVRDLLNRIPAAAPSFPATHAGWGHTNEALNAHQPFRPLLHPGPYLLLASLAAVVGYRRLGWWANLESGVVWQGWRARSQSIAVSLVGLTVLAGVMVDSGMIAAVASALTASLGTAYLAIATAVGLVGTVMTGSTSASNALLAPLQATAAAGIDVNETILIAAQTVGGNIGNALTPINVLAAATAVGAAGQEGSILRRIAPGAAVLVVVATAGVIAMAS